MTCDVVRDSYMVADALHGSIYVTVDKNMARDGLFTDSTNLWWGPWLCAPSVWHFYNMTHSVC